MAEHTLVNRYKQYKAGTTKLVTWLANTARASQDVTKILPSLRAAKDAAKRAKRKQNNAPKSPTNVMVSTSQLLNLANVVVDTSATVPDEIIQTIKAVISGREICAEWYLSLTGAANLTVDEVNKSHRYFINVLKQIQSLLENAHRNQKRKKPPTKHVQKASKAEGRNYDSLANKFSCLEIDEPSDNALALTTPLRHADRQVTFELDDHEHEKSFAIWCLLQDLRDLRRQVRVAWEDYKAGKISFSTAAMVTDTASCLAQYADTEFVDQYQDLCSYPLILKYMSLAVIQVGKDVWLCCKGQNKAIKIGQERFDNIDMAELFAPRAIMILTAFSSKTWEKLKGNPDEPQQPSTCFFGYHRFGYMLESIMPDLDMHHIPAFKLPVVDDFVSGLAYLGQHPANAPTTALVTMCQMNMDIVDVLGVPFENGLLEYHRRLEADNSSIYMFLRNWDLKNSCTCKQSLVGAVMAAKKFISGLAKDPYFEIQSKVLKEVLGDAIPDAAPYLVHKALPVIPGTIINLSAVRTHQIGIRLCNWGNIVVSLAYLYKATLRSGALKNPWPDMEFVIKTHSKLRPLVLEPENELANMAKCFGVALGMKGSAYSKGRRPRLPSNQFIEENGRRLTTEWPLMKAIEEYDGDPENRNTPFVRAAIISLQSLKEQAHKDEQLEHLCSQYQKTGKVTPAQLLIGFRAVFIEHEMDMKFDYIGFFFTCLQMLSSIKANFNCCLGTLQSEQPEVDFERAHEVVYAILWDAAEGQHGNTHNSHSIIFDAGKVMEQFIEEDGATYSDLARSQTSGFTMAPQLSPTTSMEEEAQPWEDTINLVSALMTMPGEKPFAFDGVDLFCASGEEFSDSATMVGAVFDLLKDPTSEPDSRLKKEVAYVLVQRIQQMPEHIRHFVKGQVSQIERLRQFMGGSS